MVLMDRQPRLLQTKKQCLSKTINRWWGSNNSWPITDQSTVIVAAPDSQQGDIMKIGQNVKLIKSLLTSGGKDKIFRDNDNNPISITSTINGRVNIQWDILINYFY